MITTIRSHRSHLSALLLTLLTAGLAYAEPVASVVAVRGQATIERSAKTITAQPKLGIELQDTVATAPAGRVKLLFIDDSVLTLAEKTRMSVESFIHSRSDRGKSLFNLLDGKMRAVVGKTRFEVKTPTVVAAARGTVILFEVGHRNGRPYTRVTCLEGIVDVHPRTETAGGTSGAAGGAAGGTAAPEATVLTPGQSLLVSAGQPIPAPFQLSPAELNELKRDTSTSTSGAEIKIPTAAPRETIIRNVGGAATAIRPIPVVPTFDRQQPQPKPQPTKVDIGVKF
ncbi:MAG TPA: FecR domain-containing protein [Desulfuromonadales bacterium]|nr:FecR domain-containing protein [Desulfuromonadales bacterium]